MVVTTMQNAEVNAFCLEYDAAVNSIFLHPFNSQCLTLQGACFNIRHLRRYPFLDIFYIVVVVVVTLLALAVLILIEFTERTELKLLRKSMRRPTIDIGSFFDGKTQSHDGANLIDN